ncbi:BirA family biotin operon repressor/biotin-[acetyl-CoA-carboxylase] ligase [Sedimentibacter acidaminivorans]|uniref:biotin--[biotin carboxyl-carrier protein] ligase n=1 Tax=Sedimentibacter acidaminivorans TaxID=913099 RepID=A0ABS4GEP5_9FIRM|nr:biotin--[acetyl-CoA-carboxylase] ligase [Sedimentibacter acidaminivorans]MBP1926124.1 BirA family biotin operon repressor/biotin-[acetyl-CoA-carboxylase] ligase [Sedimentibacter acidaminivorans]
MNLEEINFTNINGCSDLLTADKINKNLDTQFIGRNIIHVDTIDSTNSYAKTIGPSCDDGTVITCENQVEGRGRLGRQWKSHSGSICMSIVLKPDIDISQVSKITQVCAASVSLSLDELKVDAKIKWPNDLMINNKKICGILTEMNSYKSHVNYVVIGMGLNVNNEDFPDEIKDIATSILSETGRYIERSIIVSKILNNFEILYNEFINNKNFILSLNICKLKSNIIGKNINLIKNKEVTKAKALDLGEEGDLIVQYENGEIDSIISGEISVREIL